MLVAVFSGAVSAVQAGIGAKAAAVVQVDGGRIAGEQVTEEVRAYLGVPYAAPPVGPLGPVLVYLHTSGDPESAAINVPRYDLANELLIDLGGTVRGRRVDAGVDYFLDHPDSMIGIGAEGTSPLNIH